MTYNFLNLMIWQKAMNLTNLISRYTKDSPDTERIDLIDRMNRNSGFIPSNTAEGSGKRTKKHFAKFLSTSLSSAFKHQTELFICDRRKYGNKENFDKSPLLTVELQKKSYSFN